MKSSKLVRTGLRPLSLVQIQHLAPVPFRSTEPTVARVYREVEEEFGVLAPPVILHAAAPEVLAAAWVVLRESLLVSGRADRAVKEVVAVEISRSNECPYCLTMHAARLDGLVPPDDPAAAGSGPVRVVGEWVRDNLTRPAGPGPVPFAEDQAAELLAVAVLMQYLNRMVNIFLPEKPMPPRAPGRALVAVVPMLSWLQRAAQGGALEPGTSLDLLPPAADVPAPAWAAGNSILAEGLSRATAAIGRAGDRSVPPAVRVLVSERLAAWDGSAPGLSRAWVEEAIEPLPAADRAAGRLALLAAFSSYQVDSGVIDAYRKGASSDAALVELVSWASLSAALEIAAWMRTTPTRSEEPR